MSIEFLDCTLRDGAHVNSGRFRKEHILGIVNGLSESSVDIVEIGFLKNVDYDEDITSYPTIEDAISVLEQCKISDKSTYAVMARADTYDITKLSEYNGKIGLIRIAFYYDYLEKAMEFAEKVKKLGYKFTLNLINTPGSSLKELHELVENANRIKPYAVMIVDTFGVLDQEQLCTIIDYYDKNLSADIKIGLHAHENMSQAFSLAQMFIKKVGGHRDIIVDGSLMGIGRAPGNLCTELICNYLNTKYSKGYDINRMMKTISKDIVHIKKDCKWGYSPEYFLSAKYRVHRSYAEYLSDRDVDYDVIDTVLSKIDSDHSKYFDEDYLLNIINQKEIG